MTKRVLLVAAAMAVILVNFWPQWALNDSVRELAGHLTVLTGIDPLRQDLLTSIDPPRGEDSQGL